MIYYLHTTNRSIKTTSKMSNHQKADSQTVILTKVYTTETCGSIRSFYTRRYGNVISVRIQAPYAFITFENSVSARQALGTDRNLIPSYLIHK